MAVNLAEKYSPKVAERFAHKSFTGAIAGNAYEFEGVKGINVYSVDTVPLGNYTTSGTTRYGTPAELNDFVQNMQMSQDKAATWTIDKGNEKEQLNIKKASETLRREIDERVNPMLDKYNMKVWSAGAGQAVVTTAAPNANAALGYLQDATELADEAAFPLEGRVLVCKNNFAKLLKQNPNFVYTDKLATESIIRGEIGTLDGWKIVVMPNSYFPTDVYALAVHKSALLAPMKLKDYKIHTDPPGINGNLVEMRIIHDAFVLDAKAKGVIAICGSNSGVRCADPAIAANGNMSSLGGTEVYYTVDGTDPRCSGTRVIANATGSVGNAGETITAVAYNASCSVAYSNTITVEHT